MTRASTKRILTGIVATLFLIGLCYFIYRTFRAYLSGPSVTISEPSDYSSVATSTVTVSGKVARVQVITIDGEPITIDGNGNFSQPLLLSPGPNVITVAARDQFGHSTERSLQVAYQGTEPVLATTSPALSASSTNTAP